MADTLAMDLKLNLGWLFRDVIDLSTVKDDVTLSVEDTLADGTGLDGADSIWHDRRTLASSSSENIDMAGTLTNAFGAVVSFVKVKAILIKNRSTTAANILTVGGHATAAFINWVGAAAHTIKIGPDGVFFLWNPSLAGYAVTAATGDLLTIVNAGTTSTDYDIVIVGTTA